MKGENILKRVGLLIIVFCVLASLAMVKDGRIFGHALTLDVEENAVTLQGATAVINTTTLSENVNGYGGPTPVLIYVTDGKIDSVAPLPNSETPHFFERVTESGLLNKWNGLTLKEAAELHPDAVSGATYSSKAVIANVEAGLIKGLDLDTDTVSDSDKATDSFPVIIAIAVIAAAMIVPLFVKNRIYRIIQQILNVGVLGFWTGTFLNYTVMTGTFANGIAYSLAGLVVILMFVAAFIYPLFGKHQHYCAWICPLGSLQELASDIPVKKMHLSAGLIKNLNIFRKLLFILLLSFLWISVFTEWIDYELFSAFIVESATTSVLVVGILFIILSIWLPRPFCRFVCPVGTLLKESEGRD